MMNYIRSIEKGAGGSITMLIHKVAWWVISKSFRCRADVLSGVMRIQRVRPIFGVSLIPAGYHDQGANLQFSVSYAPKSCTEPRKQP